MTYNWNNIDGGFMVAGALKGHTSAHMAAFTLSLGTNVGDVGSRRQMAALQTIDQSGRRAAVAHFLLPTTEFSARLHDQKIIQ